MPFEAAKAVAARLCYEIRYVLVSVFGPDFVSMCCKPGDPDYQNLSINRDIIQRCKDEAKAIESQSGGASLPTSPKVPSAYAELPLWPPKTSSRPKQKRAADIESGYGTDTERSDAYSSYPGSPSSSGWTPVNTPRVTNLDNFRFPPAPRNVTSTPWVSSSPQSSPKTRPAKRSISPTKFPDEEVSSNLCPEKPLVSAKRRKISPKSSSKMTAEMEAAYTLMQLHRADAALAEQKTVVRRRRASA